MSIAPINETDRQTLHVLKGLCVRYRHLIVGIVIGTITAAFLEGGSLGLLIIVATLLMDGTSYGAMENLGPLGKFLTNATASLKSGQVFVLVMLAVIGAQLFKTMLLFFVSRQTIFLKTKVQKNIQDRVTKCIMERSYHEIVQYPSGTLSAYIGLSIAFADLIRYGSGLLICLCMTAVYVVLMTLISPSLTIVAVFVCLLMSLIFSNIVRTSARYGAIIARETTERERLSIEFFRHPRMLRVLEAEKYAEDLINNKRKKVLEVEKTHGLLLARIRPIIDTLTVVGAGTLLIGGYLLSMSGYIGSLSELLVFLVILDRLVPQIRGVNTYLGQLSRSLKSAGVVSEFVRQSDGAADAKPSGGKLGEFEKLTFKDVCFNYPQTTGKILKTISLEIPCREIVAIIGPSGSGKTTIAELMLKLYEPTNGHIDVNGRDLSSVSSSEWCRKIAIVDQKSSLLNMSIKDNIAFPTINAEQSDVVSAARKANIDDFVDSLDQGYDTIVGTDGYSLSAGQKQRLLLGRAIFRNPQILILDEATNSLDRRSENAIRESLRRLSQECAIVIIAHSRFIIEKAETIYFLEAGELKEAGKLADLVKGEGLVGRFWRGELQI